MLKEYLFQQPKGAFKVVVFAKSKHAAIRHLKAQGIGCIAYRPLKFVGMGPAKDPENWLAAIAK